MTAKNAIFGMLSGVRMFIAEDCGQFWSIAFTFDNISKIVIYHKHIYNLTLVMKDVSFQRSKENFFFLQVKHETFLKMQK